MKKPYWVAAVSIGVAIGACAREVVREVSPGAAHAQGGKRYMVRGPSVSYGGFESDLNELTAQGWRYVGPLPMGNAPSALVFER